MLGNCPPIAFAPTTDLDAARAFYADVLGIELVEDSPFACVFRAHGTMLRVTLVAAIADVPYTILGWQVPDIIAAVRTLGRRGVEFERFPGLEQDAYGVWLAPQGDRVAWFRDPDGNTLSLTQFA